MQISSISDAVNNLCESTGKEIIDNLEQLIQEVGLYLEKAGWLGNLICNKKGTLYLPEDIRKEFERVSQFLSQGEFFQKASKDPGSHRVIEDILTYTFPNNLNSNGLLIDHFLLTNPLAHQHREKIKIQIQIIINAILGPRNDPKGVIQIISLGCGQSPELKEVFCPDTLRRMHEVKRKVHFTFLDIDKDALRITAEKMHHIENKELISYNCVQGNILRHVKRLQSRFNLVIAGGLFDYFTDSSIKEILRLFYKNLQDGDEIFFTNISNGTADDEIDRTTYPYQHAIYDFVLLRGILGWVMHHRTKEELGKIVECGIGESANYQIFSIGQERTYGVHIKK